MKINSVVPEIWSYVFWVIEVAAILEVCWFGPRGALLFLVNIKFSLCICPRVHKISLEFCFYRGACAILSWQETEILLKVWINIQANVYLVLTNKQRNVITGSLYPSIKGSIFKNITWIQKAYKNYNYLYIIINTFRIKKVEIIVIQFGCETKTTNYVICMNVRVVLYHKRFLDFLLIYWGLRSH